MNFSHETQKKIEQFASTQAQHYLEEAEMTYMEKLQAKAGRATHKIGRKLARFKSRSDQALEAHLAGRLGQAHLRSQFRDRHAAVFGQGFEDFPVELVQFT